MNAVSSTRPFDMVYSDVKYSVLVCQQFSMKYKKLQAKYHKIKILFHIIQA